MYVQIMLLDIAEFREKWRRESSSFQMGVSETAFTRVLLGKILIPFYVTVYNNICRRFALCIRITFITTLAYLTPGKYTTRSAYQNAALERIMCGPPSPE